MADLGASLGRGIQLGEASRRSSEINLEQIIASLPGTRGMTRRRSSPATIRSNAADLALRERALDLQERQVAIQEKNQVILEEAAATERQRSYWRESEAIQDRAHADRRYPIRRRAA